MRMADLHTGKKTQFPHLTSLGEVDYNPVHLVESVENCGLCMRRYLACKSYTNVMHRELAITRVLRYDASARD